MWRADLDRGRTRIVEYNRGRYRGVPNIELDRNGYRMFAQAVGDNDSGRMTQLVRFIGDDYGGTQGRVLTAGFTEESERIACAIIATSPDYQGLARSQPPLHVAVPDAATLELLLAPFNASKFWIVWASKFLHFLVPNSFPILDSRAERALGFLRSAGTVRYYWKYCADIRGILLRDAAVLDQLCVHDPEHPPMLKVLDKILYEEGTPVRARSTSESARPQTTAPDIVAVETALARAPAAAPAGEHQFIPAWITDISNLHERARSGPRFELCISKEHANLFPDDRGLFDLVVHGTPWRIRIGRRDGVRHLYALTECTSPDQRTMKITELLRSAGLGVGDRPQLRLLGPRRFELCP